MRIMGLDFGSKTVGVAISDSLLVTAQGIEIIRRKEENKLRRTLARIEELILEHDVCEIDRFIESHAIYDDSHQQTRHLVVFDSTIHISHECVLYLVLF